MRRFRVLLLYAVATAAPAGAQDMAAAHRMPAIPPTALTRPIELATGIGQSHDAMDRVPPNAQAFYDQGLSYLHDYVWIDAARSFNQALHIEERLPLAYIGLSIAHE